MGYRVWLFHLPFALRHFSNKRRECHIDDRLQPSIPSFASGQQVRVGDDREGYVLDRIDQQFTTARATMTKGFERREFAQPIRKVLSIQELDQGSTLHLTLRDLNSRLYRRSPSTRRM